jgi:tetratricopeptide (TPR) repeat protein
MSAPAGAGDGSAYDRAIALRASGRIAEAERAFAELASANTDREPALAALADLYEQTSRPAKALDVLTTLAREHPDRLYYTARLAGVLEALGRFDEAIGQYLEFLRRQPDQTNGWFNLALLYRKSKLYGHAVAAYETALQLGVDDAEEVLSNMGVLYSEMRRGGDARRMYQRALEISPDYVPALFNLAGLLEEQGDRERAIELYRQILSLDPGHSEALSRLVYARRITVADEDLLVALRRGIENAGADRLGEEALRFALGKALDDLGRYDEAFSAYSAANALGRRRNLPYDPRAVERAFGRIMEVFRAPWIRQAANPSTARPIFICGMFRSGSTLVEQILGSHPSVTAGGELDFLPWLVQERLMPFPDRAGTATPDELRKLGDRYMELLKSIFPSADHVTDKRPDNFLLVGLIKRIFPGARIVYTRRDGLDNCLSVYFQQLGGNLNYATDLPNIAHYYRQHARLMKHWFECLPDELFTVNYEELVRAPEPVVRGLLAFLGLEWDPGCLDFAGGGGLVKTASVWQVRDGLHDRSVGRWNHYESHLRDARAILEGRT